MSSFPTLHDALRSFLGGGERDGMRPGLDLPGFGDGPDLDGPRFRGGDGPRFGGDGPRFGNGPDIEGPRFGGDGPRPGSGPEVEGPRFGGDGRGLDAPSYRAGDVPGLPVPANVERALDSLLRELRQLSPEVVRQLSNVLDNNPAGLRNLPASPEALAALVARAVPEGAEAAQRPASPEGRLQAGAAAERSQAADDRAERRLPGDARTAAASLAVEGRPAVEAPPGTATLLPAQQNALLARADGNPAAHPSGHAAAAGTPAGADGTTAPLLPLPSRGLNEAMTLQARAEGSVATGDRALPGSLGTAAGTTVVITTANPAGTTYAVAPQTASRLRETAGSDEKEDEDGNASQGDQEDEAGKGGAQGGADTAGSEARAQAEARAAGHTGQASANAAPRKPSLPAAAGGMLASLLKPSAAQPHGHVGEGYEERERRRSRRLRWLYWSLTVVAYACFVAALALVWPALGLTGSASAADTAPARHVLTAVGLVSALAAWMLARRMR